MFYGSSKYGHTTKKLLEALEKLGLSFSYTGVYTYKNMFKLFWSNLYIRQSFHLFEITASITSLLNSPYIRYVHFITACIILHMHNDDTLYRAKPSMFRKALY